MGRLYEYPAEQGEKRDSRFPQQLPVIVGRVP